MSSGGWRWLRPDVVLALHEEHLAEHGGLAGVRDAAGLEAALARPRQLAAYGDVAGDVAALAAAYAWGIARNHPFADGNKRTSLIAAELFLVLNGYELDATDAECVHMFQALAAGEVTEDALTDWFRRHLRENG